MATYNRRIEQVQKEIDEARKRPWKVAPLLVLPWSGRPIPEMSDFVGELRWRLGCERIQRGGTGVDWLRSALASEALLSPFEWWLWCDNDNFHLVERTVQMVAAAQEHDLDMLACVIPCRAPSTWANIGAVSEPQRIVLGAAGSITPVSHAGLALAVTHRRVFERIRDCVKDDWVGWTGMHQVDIKTGVEAEQFDGYPFFIPFVEGRDYVKEDVAFCRRAIRSGSKLWADTSMVGLHATERFLGFSDIVKAEERRSEVRRMKEIEVD